MGRNGQGSQSTSNIRTSSVCHFTQIPHIVEEYNLTVPGICKSISLKLFTLGLNFRRYCHSENRTCIFPTNIMQLSNSNLTILDILRAWITYIGQLSKLGCNDYIASAISESACRVCIIYHGDSFIWNTGFRFVLIIFSVIITEIVTKTDDLRIIGFDWIFLYCLFIWFWNIIKK